VNKDEKQTIINHFDKSFSK